MTAADLLSQVLAYASANSVGQITAAAPYLEALSRELGDRDAQTVTAADLRWFHRRASPDLAAPVTAALERKSARWEAIYAFRARGALERLPWESERPLGALVRLFDDPSFTPRRALELGCGDGVNAIFLAQRGCRVRAVDVSPSAIELARARAHDAGARVDFSVADVFSLPPGGEPFDLVFDRGLLHHLQVFQFEDYRQLVHDRLAAGGTFHLVCHHVSDRPTLVGDVFTGSLGKLLGLLSGALVEAGTGFTESELRQIFAEGFRFESIELIGDDLNRPFRFLSTVLARRP